MSSTTPNGRSQAVQLGAELRDLRKRAQMTVTQVASALGFHHSTVSRWERGESMPSEADTAASLAIYGITGEERNRLIELARHDDIPDWVAPIGKQLAALIEYERAAHKITELNPLLIPGLLQTHDYARSLMIAAGAPLGQAAQGAMIRLGRQNILTRHKPVTYVAIIGEQAVRYPPSGYEIMAEQLHHLLTVSERPNIDIRVLPFGGKYTRAHEGSFILLEFRHDNPVVLVESGWSSSLLTNPRTVLGYHDSLDGLLASTMNSAASTEFIAQLATEMETKA